MLSALRGRGAEGGGCAGGASTVTAVKAFQTVLAHVEQGILDGSLQVGSLLPAEREDRKSVV